MPRFAAIFTLALVGAATSAPASFAADPAPDAPPAAPTTKQLYASPLVNFEQLGRQGLVGPLAPGVLDGADAASREGAPLFLQPPEGLSSFPQIAPPDGGGLITIVE